VQRRGPNDLGELHDVSIVGSLATVVQPCTSICRPLCRSVSIVGSLATVVQRRGPNDLGELHDVSIVGSLATVVQLETQDELTVIIEFQ